MKKHTTFGIGGPADLFILPNKNSQIKEIINIIKNKNQISQLYIISQQQTVSI